MGSDAKTREAKAWARRRGRATRALAQALVFGCGALSVLAVQGSLYACACVIALLGVWMAAAALQQREAEKAATPEREGPPRASGPDDLLSNLLDQTPAPLLIYEPHGAIRAGNRAARALFGTDDRLLEPPPGLLDALRTGAPGDRLTLNLPTDRTMRTYAMPITDIVRDGEGGVARLAALIDIEPELRAAEAGALRELLQVLSHEIMNALTPVASLAATAEDLMGDRTPKSLILAQEAVATLARRADGLTRFVEAYRTLARLPPPQLAPTHLANLLEEVARLFRSRWGAQGVELELTPPPADLIVKLDPDLIIHALMNVLSNGAEAAMHVEGRTAKVQLSGVPKAEGATIRITDNGPGVPSEARDQIFQPFFTTKSHGSGVGLSFARQVALSHGGLLTLLPPRAGCGAAFEFEL